jgi:hypothetical protein
MASFSNITIPKSILSKAGLSNAGSQWELHAEDGGGAVVFTSMLSIDISHPGGVVSEPIEEGSFASYNKQVDAIEINVSLGTNGGESDIGATLRKLEELRQGLVKITLVTPAQSYDSLSLESFNYSRQADSGAYFLAVDMKLKQIREVETDVATTALPEAECKNPGSASKKSGGRAGTSETDEPKKQTSSSALSDITGRGKKQQ